MFIDYLKYKLPNSLVYEILSFCPWMNAFVMPFIQNGYFLKGYCVHRMCIRDRFYHVEYHDCIDVYDFGWSDDGYEVDEFGQMVVPPTFLQVSSDKKTCMTQDGLHKKQISPHVVMVMSSMLAGLLSTMNVYANDWKAITFTSNDVYCILMMTGWMFFFTGLLTGYWKQMIVGLLVAMVFLTAIRTQFQVTQNQYLESMTTHHSMAVMMSSRLLSKPDVSIRPFLYKIIKTQNNEIMYMEKVQSSTSFSSQKRILWRCTYILVILIVGYILSFTF